MAKSADSLTSSLNKLRVSSKPQKSEPADSWEDEFEEDSGPVTPVHEALPTGHPHPPPPTPSSPSYSSRTTMKGSPYQTFPPFGMGSDAYDGLDRSTDSSPLGQEENKKRPETSTAVASRLIAAGIGQAAPRRTKEQREYDQAMKLQEKKKRDQAKEEEEEKEREKERAKQAIWDD